MSSIHDIRDLDQLEANVERVFKAVRGLREDECGLVLGIAHYALVWLAADAHVLPELQGAERDEARASIIGEIRDLTLTQGKAYAEALIAEGSIRSRVRPAP